MCPRRGEYRDAVSYSQAHLRVKNDKGRADAHTCIECGDPAREWAYMGGDADEMVDDIGRHYSINQALYEPMCIPCHRRHDRAAADGRPLSQCPRGHEWTPENTGIRAKRAKGSGIRFCRACHRENARDYRARHAA